jgi:O-antigen ligase
MLIATTWAFGGNIASARLPLSLIGSIGILITFAAFRERHRANSTPASRSLRWLLPLLGYNLLVIASTTQPLFRTAFVEGTDVFIPRPDASAWPGTIRPRETLLQLWLFNALFLPAFNLALVVRSRRVLRQLLALAALNGVALAIFGSLQKLSGASGLFFGAVPSPNKTFFASFIYHNHWGAYAVLTLGACFGLIFHQIREGNHRDFWHSPAFASTVAALLLAASIPLSTSRSCTLLALVVLGIALIHATRNLARGTARRSRAPAFSLLLIAATLVAAGFVIYDLARPAISARLADTRSQLAQMRAQGGIGGRATLYADTWRLARERLWTGWGLGSYGTAFIFYNSQSASDGLPVYFRDAHSDWLQSVAETGLIGTALLGLLVLLPLTSVARRARIAALPAYLLLGCLLLLLYAWVEFPFGCPAVVLMFWLTLFSGVRLVQLEEKSLPRASAPGEPSRGA